jgi:hypothetical protein
MACLKVPSRLPHSIHSYVQKVCFMTAQDRGGSSACADAAAEDLSFRVITRIPRRLECNLLVVTAQKLVLCQVRRTSCTGDV